MDDIHSLSRNQKPLSETGKQIESWLSKHPKIDAVIWTGLTSNWFDRRNINFSYNDLVQYLNSKKETIGLIKQYFDKAPAQTQTVAREVFMKWCKDQGD